VEESFAGGMKMTLSVNDFQILLRLTTALEKLASCVDKDKKAFRMYDTDRAKVYGEHLGTKLRDK
jgi:hypothetical protein